MTDQKIPAPMAPPMPPLKPMSPVAPTAPIAPITPKITAIPTPVAPSTLAARPPGQPPVAPPPMPKALAAPPSSMVKPPQPSPILAAPAFPAMPMIPKMPPAATPPTPATPTTSPAAAAPLKPVTKPPVKATAPASSPFRFLPFVVLILVILGGAFFLLSKLLAPQPVSTTRPTGTTGTSTGASQTGTSLTGSGQSVTLTYWGLWEPSRVLADVLSDYEKAHPGVKVSYVQQSYRDYRERLQTAVASNKGPDVFRFHASWTPMLRSELSAMPSSVYSSTDFSSTFYPAAAKQLTSNGQLVGVPLMYDGLALFYNKEILRAANAEPPKTWSEFQKLAAQLTVRTAGKITRAGAAVGNASNIDNFADIIGLLMLQNGANPAAPSSPEATEALTFYTNFYTKDQVWDETLPNSTVAFARGDVAMILAPSWRAHDIMATNPNLSFGVAPVPQFSSNKITWASYWAEGVSAQSKYKKESWDLIKYLSSQEVLRKLFSTASKERAFGEIYSRVDMATELGSNQYAASYLSDAPYAQGWYLSSFTHDNGINDQLIKYYEDAVTKASGGSNLIETLVTVDQGTRQVLRQFGVAVPAAPVTDEAQ